MGLHKRLEAIEMVLVLNEDGKAALEAAKADWVEKLDALYNDGKGTEAGILAKADYDKAVADMNSALTVDELSAAYDVAEDALMTAEEYNLAMAKENAKAALDAKFPREDYTVYATELETALAESKAKIDDCTSLNEVSNMLLAEENRIDADDDDKGVVYSDTKNALKYAEQLEQLKTAIKSFTTNSEMIEQVMGKPDVENLETEKPDDLVKVTFKLLAEPKYTASIDAALANATKWTEVKDYIETAAVEVDGETTVPRTSRLRQDLLKALKEVLVELADEFYNDGNQVTVVFPKKTLTNKGETDKEEKYLISTSDYEAFLEKVEHAGMKENKETNTWEDLPFPSGTDENIQALCGSYSSHDKGFNKLMNDSKDDDGTRFTAATTGIRDKVSKLFNDVTDADGSTDYFVAPLKKNDNKPVHMNDYEEIYVKLSEIASIKNAIETSGRAIDSSTTQPQLDAALKNAKAEVLKQTKLFIDTLMQGHVSRAYKYALSTTDYNELKAKLDAITVDSVSEDTKKNALQLAIDVYNVDAKAKMEAQQKIDIKEDVKVSVDTATLDKVMKEDYFSGNIKSANELQSGVTVGEKYRKIGDNENTVRYDITAGSIKYVEGFEKFSKSSENQKGYYLALSFTNPSASKIIKVEVSDKSGSFTDKKISTENDNMLNIIWKLDGEEGYVNRQIRITYGDELTNQSVVIYTLTDGIKLEPHA